MFSIFKKTPILRLESDLTKSCFEELECREALQDVFRMLRRVTEGEALVVQLSALYEEQLKQNDALRALALAFQTTQKETSYEAVISGVKASYDISYPYVLLATLLFASAAGCAYIGTIGFCVLAVFAVCLAVGHTVAYVQAAKDHAIQPRLLDEKLLYVEQALEFLLNPKAKDAMGSGMLIVDADENDDEDSSSGQSFEL